MSISFNGTPNTLAQEFLKQIAGDERFTDGKSFLYDEMPEINQKQMTELANKAGQPVTVEMRGEGEIKTMADGTQYRVTRSGWRKVSNG